VKSVDKYSFFLRVAIRVAAVGWVLTHLFRQAAAVRVRNDGSKPILRFVRLPTPQPGKPPELHAETAATAIKSSLLRAKKPGSGLLLA
jgi:hypothetical protein